MRIPRAERGALTLILLVAAGVRIAACLHWREDLAGDPDAYCAYAERLAEGSGYVSPEGRPTAFRPPLYPLLLACMLWGGQAGIATLHVVLGVATVALTCGLGRRLGLGRFSLAAAALVAVDPLLLRYTPHVMTEVTCAFLSALVLFLAATRRWRLLLGLAFGLAILTRPTFLAFGALVGAGWVWNRLRTGRWLPSIRQSALILAGAALVAAPWMLRNGFELGHPILTTTHGGYTLLLANNPVFWREVVEGPPNARWSGESLDAWQRSLESSLKDAGVPPGDERARDRWMQRRAIEHMRDEPLHLLRAVAYRISRFWGLAPVSGSDATPSIRAAVAVFYTTVFVAALIGAVTVAIKRDTARGGGDPALDARAASWRPALLLLVAFTGVHALYWTDTRMRAPLVPVIAVLAARGVASAPRLLIQATRRLN